METSNRRERRGIRPSWKEQSEPLALSLEVTGLTWERLQPQSQVRWARPKLIGDAGYRLQVLPSCSLAAFSH